ncbi:hypothetical protein J4436_02965 [Candidatus Woesearchaeota archaeon]|nr:hypothetical protein [Candidatus Woesearchaeota archaeon]
MLEELEKNIQEFTLSGEENLKRGRYNASVSDFFKAIVIMCDYLIYKEIKSLPKNHNERFNFLKKYFEDIYSDVSNLFEMYTKSYNLRLEQKDALNLKNYANGLKNRIFNKK